MYDARPAPAARRSDDGSSATARGARLLALILCCGAPASGAAVVTLADLLEAQCRRVGAHADRADPMPRRSLSVSYCRFIE